MYIYAHTPPNTYFKLLTSILIIILFYYSTINFNQNYTIFKLWSE